MKFLTDTESKCFRLVGISRAETGQELMLTIDGVDIGFFNEDDDSINIFTNQEKKPVEGLLSFKLQDLLDEQE